MSVARRRGLLLALILLGLWLLFGPGLINRAGLLLLGIDGLPPGLEPQGQLYYTQGFDGLWRHDLRTNVSERWWLPAEGSLVSGVAVAPDGGKLALTWASPGDSGYQPGTTDIWLSGLTEMNPHPLLVRMGLLESWRDPFWSADGQSLLVTHQFPVRDDAGDAQTVQLNVLRVDLEGTRSTLLENAEQAALSVDDGRLVWLQIDPQTWAQSLMLASADGSEARVLVAAGTFRALASPRFTQEADAIVFSASGSRQDPAAAARVAAGAALAHGDPWNIWRVDLVDGELTRLTETTLDGPMLAWIAQGDALAVLAAEGLYLHYQGAMWRLAAVATEGIVSWAPGPG